METNKKINCPEIPQTLTTEFWIECLHSPYPQISEAALVKLIRENLEQSQPRLTFSEAEINWGIPGTAYLNIEQTPRELCQLIYSIACEINRTKVLENCIKLLDEGMACHYCYENYLDICELLGNLDSCNPLRQNCLEVLNRHYSAYYFKHLQQLIVLSEDAPEIGEIILRLLKEARPIQPETEGLRLNGINKLRTSDTETLYQIYRELCRLGSFEILISIARCYRALPKRYHRRMEQQIYQSYRKWAAETKMTCLANISNQIAKNLPPRQGCRIYRNLLSRGEYGYSNDYIRYCCQNPHYFPNRELIFLDQKIIPQSASWVLPELCFVLKKNSTAENFCTQILTWLEKWKTFALELYGEDIFEIIRELKNTIMLWQQSTPNKNGLSLIARCQYLIEYFYADILASPEKCIDYISCCLAENNDWKEIIDRKKNPDQNFIAAFISTLLEHETPELKNAAEEIIEYFGRVNQIGIGDKRPTPAKADDPSSYIAAVLELLSRN